MGDVLYDTTEEKRRKTADVHYLHTKPKPKEGKDQKFIDIVRQYGSLGKVIDEGRQGLKVGVFVH